MTALIPELYVSDLDVSLDFYLTLGFRIVYRRPEEYFARIARGGAEIMLEEPHGRTWLMAALASPRGVGINLQIDVEDIASLYSVVPEETPVVLPPETKVYCRSDDEVTVRQFVVADPDGYLLRFSEILEITPKRPQATP